MAAFSNPVAYERWMGRWSRRLAPALVAFADPPNGARLLDVGSGTGALSLALVECVADAMVIGIEPAEAYVSHSRAQIANSRLRFQVGDALDISFDDDSFDSTISLLILQELPDAPLALKEMRRVTRPGGTVAASQWDFAHGLPMLGLFWDTVLEVAPSEIAYRVANNTLQVDHPDDVALQKLWHDTGLVEVETARHTVDMTFSSFEDYWTPFLGNVTPTSSYVGTLAADKAAEIKRLLQQKTVGDEPDQPFILQADAWAVRGTVP